jgi:hypothetical protein
LAARPDTAKAAISGDPKKFLWPREKYPIKVAFVSGKKKVSLLKEWGLNEVTILEWANRWSSGGSGKIPSFDLCQKEKHADIVVELNGIKAE